MFSKLNAIRGYFSTHKNSHGKEYIFRIPRWLSEMLDQQDVQIPEDISKAIIRKKNKNKNSYYNVPVTITEWLVLTQEELHYAPSVIALITHEQEDLYQSSLNSNQHLKE